MSQPLHHGPRDFEVMFANKLVSKPTVGIIYSDESWQGALTQAQADPAHNFTSTFILYIRDATTGIIAARGSINGTVTAV